MLLLRCGCCGGSAIGRQHWNHDTGYGLCAKCVYDFLANPKWTSELDGYGRAGHHFAIPLARPVPPGALVSFRLVGDEDGEYRVGTLKEVDNGTALIREHRRLVTGEDDANISVPV